MIKSVSKITLSAILLSGIVSVYTGKVSAEDTDTSKSSTAIFSLEEGSGKLTLDSVPRFDFGKVDPAKIYAKGTADGKGLGSFMITDTRLNTTGWSLSVASTTSFAHEKSEIDGNLYFTPESFAFSTGSASGWSFPGTTITIPSSNPSVIAKSTGNKGTGSASVSDANLKFTDNTALVAGEYTSNITWNLATGTADVARASD
ncbi:hypothetical protein FC52_GL000626 [Lactobacillus pasteurii DSM 23907 = CRBIP 24.76]|uniref:WxL domain-containing protein n=1 Tax=Lactobacillus pasteurii DSM 23907 = CRBIP 24.76 TaxID=1423790 RepID=I7IZE8_9LACO|nr:WxL domain-containing protein [Lactobacillus pasteurii]KRK07455.1 hypothetical protein FC52_GL000626 [Lactobacillus pasteurii DSM 23907 = CRBIP 24.76]TDG76702.1 hypothetical protein C5L33_000263 [Lactobacillus pasteurii]CCI85062.1 Putative uncharacterized protein [Lactobacillus pasteurii DSM 23907 = CRBIP 24.76]